MMDNFKQWLSKTGTKIAITISLVCISLFVLLNVVVIKSSHDSLVNVLSGVRLEPLPGFSSAIPGYRLYWAHPLRGTQTIGEMSGLDVMRFDMDSNSNTGPRSLADIFTERFQASLVSVGMIAIAASFGIGYLASRIFTKPLARLSKGMVKLRENDYRFKLEKTGTVEFDEVADEFNRLTDELQKVEVLRKDLIADTSHELKTPLASLLGQLEGIRDGVLHLDENRTNILLSQVHRLDDMVERLQEFSRLRNKSQSLRRSNINLRNVLEKVKTARQAELNSQNIAMNINTPAEFTINADEGLIEQVFNNLVSNTLAYSNARNISIEAHEEELSYSDDGIGIPVDHLPYIFERFYRVEKSRNRQTGGLGLGLAIVKEIIEAHGWQTKVESQQPVGLKYRFIL
jgi:two-component system sensor histidine kinase BaeS